MAGRTLRGTTDEEYTTGSMILDAMGTVAGVIVIICVLLAIPSNQSAEAYPQVPQQTTSMNNDYVRQVIDITSMSRNGVIYKSQYYRFFEVVVPKHTTKVIVGQSRCYCRYVTYWTKHFDVPGTDAIVIPIHRDTNDAEFRLEREGGLPYAGPYKLDELEYTNWSDVSGPVKRRGTRP